MHKHTEKAHKLIKRTGYHTGGAASGEGRLEKAEDAAMVRKGVHEHEANMHKGKAKTKLKFASGGAVSGHAAPQRLDKKARGGHMKPSKKPQVTVNVISPSNPGPNTPMPPAMPLPPMAGPSAGPPPGMTPPPPPPPMGGMATGGKVAASMRTKAEGPLADIDRPSRKDATERFYRGGELKVGHKFEGGAASGEGRLEKAELEKRSKKG